MVMSTPTDRQRAKDIFVDLVTNVPPDEWADRLLQACEGDVNLETHVRALLRAHADPGTFMDQPAIAVDAALDTPIVEQPGTVIGPYKLLQQIGEGGMGVVFLAEQELPVKRRVALKIIKPGMDTREVMARFEAERQVLAMMDHPNIAKVLDAGTTAPPPSPFGREAGGEGALSPPLPPGEGRGEGALTPALDSRPSTLDHPGRPYFVMELVQGVPITDYCDECNLTTNERLELFVAVCQAVQHAHQKGIIHRDIKPTNVLIANLDGKPSPKIIDFGVAKAIGQQLTEHTLMTAFAQMVGTPLYMSQEQAELSPMGVDTRTDIYSLGVLLYELLTSTTPFDKDRLRAASYDEMRRIIREEEPPRPSARLSSLSLRERAGVRETAALATTIAEHRRTDVRRLTQQVRGELDWIVMKCLDKDRNRRYETPSALTRDIERYLRDEPVQACPPSASYRFRKFTSRNKVALAFVTLLVSGLIYLAYSNVVIRGERNAKTTALNRAEAFAGLLQESVGSVSPGLDRENDYTVRRLMVYDDVRIAYFLATTDRQDEAAEFVRKAALDAKPLADPVGLANSLYYIALMQLRLGDKAGYRANCRALFEVPVDTLDDTMQSRPIWTSCLGPNSLEDLNRPVKRAERLVASASPISRHFWLTVLGAALYRAGQYEAAHERLEEAGAAYPSGSPGPFFDVRNYQRLFLAMTKWRLGQREQSGRLLTEVQLSVDKELQSPSIVWNRRAALEVLRLEAETLIGLQQANEAVENKSQTSSSTATQN